MLRGLHRACRVCGLRLRRGLADAPDVRGGDDGGDVPFEGRVPAEEGEEGATPDRVLPALEQDRLEH